LGSTGLGRKETVEPFDVRFLAALRGAPITILIAMYLIERASGPDELSAVTGYRPSTVSATLQQLALDGWVVNARRYRGWMLTPAARQLPAFTRSDLAPPARSENDSSLAVVGSSDSQSDHYLRPTTTTGARSENDSSRRYADFPFRVRALADPIIRAGCDPRRACEVVELVLSDGDSPDAIRDYVARWLAYRDGGARGVDNWGRLIARRLEQNAPPPDGPVQPTLIDVCPVCQFTSGQHAANCPHRSA